MGQNRDNSGIDRRTTLGLTLALTGLPLYAQASAVAAAETIPLWPSTPPSGEGVSLSPVSVDQSTDPKLPDRDISGIGRPELTVFRPEKPDGSALLIAPGGGYSFEAVDREGAEPAQRFARDGATTFVLTYRLPFEGWKDAANVPLQDAQRAMRLIRHQGPARFGIAPQHVGVLGFSAGGHLAALLATKYGSTTYAPVDAADDMDARPSFAGLIYPVITMRQPFAHESSVEKLLGSNASVSARAAYSPELFVGANTPPCFLVAAVDDPDVPVDNTLVMFQSLRTQKIDTEMHIFEKGGHGFGLRLAPAIPASSWPDLFQRWAASHGYFRAG